MNKHHEKITINGKDLTLKKVIDIARGNAEVEIATESKEKLSRTSSELRKYVDDILDECKEKIKELSEVELKRKMIYGVTTGFGELKKNFIKEKADAKKIQKNIILSHSCGVGREFDWETTRAIMLLRANTLASGYCGIGLEAVEQLKNFLNLGVCPSIPEQGSVGASGDLAPLSHLALGLIGEGKVKYRKHDGEKPEEESEESFDNLEALTTKYPDELKAIKPRLELNYKEGLAMVNGLAVMTGVGVLAHADAEDLVDWADVTGAMTLECMLGSSRAFDEIIFTVYGHKGAKTSARNVRDVIKGSKLINLNADVHDAYSVRCIPQVHGAARDALNYVETTLGNQLNTVDDDPIIFSDEEIANNKPMDGWFERKHFEHGNFHGEPVAFAMDLLAIVVAELGNIAERRIQMLMDKNHNRDLPACLIDNPAGINTGYMIAQYTAAALVSENKTLCHPASVDSIPTSANAEDHVSMGTISARKARKVIENVRNILAIELLCATEALSYRLGEQSLSNKEAQKKIVTGECCGEKTRGLYDQVKAAHVAENDRPFLNGEEAIVNHRINRVRKEFLSKSPYEFIER